MQQVCNAQDDCIHFFPGIGYRPAQQVTQRDQYGDKSILIVGKDTPLEGKYTPAINSYDALPADIGGLYAMLPAATVAPGATPSGGASGPVFAGSSGSPGISFGNGGGTSDFNEPARPILPGGNPGTNTPGGGGTTEVPGGPDWPENPQQPTPVPLSDSGMFLVIAFAALLLCKSRFFAAGTSSCR